MIRTGVQYLFVFKYFFKIVADVASRLWSSRLGSVFSMIALLSLSACDPPRGEYPKPGSTCEVARDQRGTFFQPIENLPATVHIDPSFTGSEKRAIKRAVKEWNRLSEATLGKKFFVIGQERAVADYGDYFSTAQYCGSSVGEGIQIVSETSADHWRKMGQSIVTAGVTRRCSTGGADGNPQMIVALNTLSLIHDMKFFETVALHELGHVLGLNHSCERSGGSYDVASCGQLPSGHPYVLSVVTGDADLRSVTVNGYTKILGQSCSKLQQNDIDRAYCLYTGKAGE